MQKAIELWKFRSREVDDTRILALGVAISLPEMGGLKETYMSITEVRYYRRNQPPRDGRTERQIFWKRDRIIVCSSRNQSSQNWRAEAALQPRFA
ncbi:MAG TPA: hypothetical protein V6D10_17255 [Trichocoleus sp.]